MPAKFFLPHPPLQSQLDDVLEATWQAFPNLAQNQIAVTWIAYEPPYRVNTGGGLSAEEFWKYQPQGASYRGVELMEPDSIVHLFYVVAMQVWLEQGMAQPSAEIDRAMTDALTRGSHDAASFLLDVLTGTTSGPALPSGPDETWASQRNIVNRYFANLGWPELRSVNMNQKTWCDRPYGREKDFLGAALENRNQLTTEATARLLHSIVGGVSVSRVRSQFVMDLLAQPAARIWSQSVVTSTVAHSLTYSEVSGTHPYLLVVFSTPDKPPSKVRSHSSDSWYSHSPTMSDEVSQHAELISFVLQQILDVSQQNFERNSG